MASKFGLAGYNIMTIPMPVLLLLIGHSLYSNSPDLEVFADFKETHQPWNLEVVPMMSKSFCMQSFDINLVRGLSLGNICFVVFQQCYARSTDFHPFVNSVGLALQYAHVSSTWVHIQWGQSLQTVFPRNGKIVPL